MEPSLGLSCKSPKRHLSIRTDTTAPPFAPGRYLVDRSGLEVPSDRWMRLVNDSLKTWRASKAVGCQAREQGCADHLTDRPILMFDQNHHRPTVVNNLRRFGYHQMHCRSSCFAGTWHYCFGVCRCHVRGTGIFLAAFMLLVAGVDVAAAVCVLGVQNVGAGVLE